MNIFFGVPYSNKVDQNGEVFPWYRAELEQILGVTRSLGHTAFCAPEYDGWHINNMSPAEAYKLDTEQLEKADVFIGILESERPSIGVCMEIYGAAKQKIPTLVICDKKDPVYMIAGLTSCLDHAHQKVCNNPEERFEAIESFLSQITT